MLTAGPLCSSNASRVPTCSWGDSWAPGWCCSPLRVAQSSHGGNGAACRHSWPSWQRAFKRVSRSGLPPSRSGNSWHTKLIRGECWGGHRMILHAGRMRIHVHTSFNGQNVYECRFSRSPYSKVLALLYLTLALVLVGAVGLSIVTRQTFYSAVWEAIAGESYLKSCRQQIVSITLLHDSRELNILAGNMLAVLCRCWH